MDWQEIYQELTGERNLSEIPAVVVINGRFHEIEDFSWNDYDGDRTLILNAQSVD